MIEKKVVDEVVESMREFERINFQVRIHKLFTMIFMVLMGWFLGLTFYLIGVINVFGAWIVIISVTGIILTLEVWFDRIVRELTSLALIQPHNPASQGPTGGESDEQD